MKKKKLTLSYQSWLIVFLFLLIGFFAIIGEGIILKPSVLFGLTENIGEIGLMAFPMTFIICTGGIDLSIGSTMALSAVCMGYVYESTANLPLAILTALCTGLACGALNGLIISRTKVSPMVTTLATYSLFWGLAKIIAGTNIYSSFPKGFRFLSNHRLFGIIPYQFLLLILVFIVFQIIFTRTAAGRCLRSIGYNDPATQFSGIDTQKVKFIIYTLSGAIAGFASLIYLSRLSAAKADIGLNLNMETITMVVLGGTSTTGGVGSVKGTFIAALILGVLRKGMQIIGLGGDTYNFILGIVLIACLITLAISTERKGKKATKSS